MMPELLTVKQLQEILQVDRTTIYRMLDEKELPGFKVGSQWRFSRQAIEQWLDSHQSGAAPVSVERRSATSQNPDLLPISCIQPIQDVFAEALGIAAVTTDADGKRITDVSNQSRFCRLIQSTERGRARCRDSWVELGRRAHGRPVIARCHAGLSYAGSRVEVNNQLVALVFGGQFVIDSLNSVPSGDETRAVATACNLDADRLTEASRDVRHITRQEAERIMRLLNRVAYTFCHIGQERADLFSRFEHIAQITGTIVGMQPVPAGSDL
jgi:excisionase family DNA binding protein